MLIVYLAVLFSAVFFVVKMLLPEMTQPPLPSETKLPNQFKLPKMPKLPVLPKAVKDLKPAEDADTNDPYKRIVKLETLLTEKNKNIQLLQTELKIFIVQVREFDKLKNILEEEIQRLREQNRIFRSELGLPATQVKENAVT